MDAFVSSPNLVAQKLNIEFSYRKWTHVCLGVGVDVGQVADTKHGPAQDVGRCVALQRGLAEVPDVTQPAVERSWKLVGQRVVERK